MEIIVVVLVLAYLVSQFAKRTNTVSLKICKPHRWLYEKQPDTEDEFLRCSECKKTPTDILNEL
jgi:hypothetical protein